MIKSMGGRQGLAKKDLLAEFPSVVIRLRGSKTDQGAVGQSIKMASLAGEKTACPVRNLAAYLAVRPPSTGAKAQHERGLEQLLIHLNGQPLTRSQFQGVVKKAASFLDWPVEAYSSHSFRIGAATTAALEGASEEKIMKLGRWRSAAFRSYCRRDRV